MACCRSSKGLAVGQREGQLQRARCRHVAQPVVQQLDQFAPAVCRPRQAVTVWMKPARSSSARSTAVCRKGAAAVLVARHRQPYGVGAGLGCSTGAEMPGSWFSRDLRFDLRSAVASAAGPPSSAAR